MKNLWRWNVVLNGLCERHAEDPCSKHNVEHAKDNLKYGRATKKTFKIIGWALRVPS